MLFLTLAILCSFTNSLLIKQNEALGLDTRVILASNYISAIGLGWCFVLANGIDGLSTQTVLLSTVGGVLWPVSFYMLMWGIRQYGLSLAGSISRLSLSVPILFAVTFLREQVTRYMALGIIVWASVLVQRIAIRRKALLRGIILGIPNFLSTYFLLESLQTPYFNTRSAVVYTLFSVAGVILAFVSGVAFWKEEITWRNALGIVFAVGAIILLNLGQ